MMRPAPAGKVLLP